MTITRKEMKALIKEALQEALMNSQVLSKIVSECVDASVSQVLNSQILKESFSTKIKNDVLPNIPKTIQKPLQTMKESQRKMIGSEVFKTDDIKKQVEFGKNMFAEIMNDNNNPSRPPPEHLTRNVMEDAEELLGDPRIVKAREIMKKMERT